MSYSNQLLNDILASLKQNGFGIDDLAAFTGSYGDERSKRQNLKTSFPNENDSDAPKQRNLPYNLSYALLFKFLIPLETVQNFIDPKVLKEFNTTTRNFPNYDSLLEVHKIDFTDPLNVKKYVSILDVYTSRARKRLLVSEYVPGFDSSNVPSWKAIKGYKEAHQLSGKCFYSTMRDNKNLKYLRILRAPVLGPETEAIHHGLINCKTLIFNSMMDFSRRFHGRCYLYAYPQQEDVSYALIDDQYLIKETYKKVYEKGHLAIYPYLMTVVRISQSNGILFNMYRDEFLNIVNDYDYRINLNDLGESFYNALEFFFYDGKKGISADVISRFENYANEIKDQDFKVRGKLDHYKIKKLRKELKFFRDEPMEVDKWLEAFNTLE